MVTFNNKCHTQFGLVYKLAPVSHYSPATVFKLSPNRAYSLKLPPLWSGRFWGRHGCSFDKSGRGRCTTGDYGGSLLCNGAGGVPPATLAEITLGHDQDFYDASLVDGYNMAMFKVACPKAYSYAHDDPTSVATCSKANYVVTFCPHHGH